MMIKFESLFDLQKVFPTEESCIKYFEERRWKGKVISPFDPTSQVYFCPNNNRWRCRNTGKYFSVRTGTIFESSKVSLIKWFWVACVLSTNSISCYKLAKYIKVTPKTALFILHRLRYGFKHPNFIEGLLKDFVEIDESFIGGKNKNRHWDKKVPHSQGRSWKDKLPVLGILQRDGKLIIKVIPDTRLNTVEPIIEENVKQGSNILTDEWYRHSNLFRNYNHQWVNHSAKQYVNGEASTNSIENCWSHLKKMIYGTHVKISRKHAQKYMDEFAFRYNTRNHDIQEKFDLVLLSMVGKRLTYQQLVS